MKSPVKLSAGPLQAFFEEGGLRTIAYGGQEIVRGIYAAVRDRNWGTVAPRLEIKRIQSLHDQAIVEFHCRHAQDEIDFEWNGMIRMTPDSIRFDFDGIARASFLKNRIGFCVLHPMGFAGLPLEVDTEEGIARGAFPERIAPHQPFKGVRAMTYEPAPGCRVRMIFSGDLFEMEDQRNWTDASYKTYCTPLSVPYPASVQAGERIAQTVLIEIEGEAAEEAGLGRGGTNDSAQREAVRIAVRRESGCALPGIGIALGPNGIDSRAAERLSRLKPSHLRGTLDLSCAEWPIRLEEAVDAAERIGCGLELEVLLDEGGRRAAELAEKLAVSGIGRRGIWLIPYSAGAIVTDEAALRGMRSAIRASGLELPVGGGTRAYYAEFNRSALPLAEMDFAAYTINPQVHAFDDRSLMETLAAQRTTADDAAFKSGKPLSIGPITFKPRLNPNATSGDGSIPIADQTDDRQGEKFGTAWTLGSLAALCTPETRRLTYYEASGPLGVAPDGAPIPLYFLLQDVMAEPDARVLAVQCSSGRAAALALRHPEGRLRLTVANLENEAQEVDIDLGADSIYSVATNFYGESEERATEQLPAQAGRRVMLTLQPYGCIRLDCRDTDAADAAESTENAHEKGL
ncbi:hypothetical protein B1A99_27915 [Cohnella sp. CIP 111063]|uniref:hypothetical protein n=1 Tax=unclassified Cohnella TaxID=2636738 RepID=UPI000B8BE168|nr:MULTISPECIES: hypothetical protein [unclassified Cohnella]OXS54064.1 hypothetical protein B1A99_27915 [Cohnella sp. CIP 111063]PRX62937.1 hypothetical protein B0G52_12290 [Cohnella sp. SGD-V74]